MRPKQFKFVGFCGMAVLLVAALFLMQNQDRSSASARTRVGDTKSTVTSLLGKPTTVFTNALTSLKYGGEVWAYGKKFDWNTAMNGGFPFKLRLVAPERGDFLVVFGADGVVTRLQVPESK